MFRARQYLIFFVFMALLVSLFFRLFFLQVLNFDRFSVMAAGQHNRVLEIEPRRGAIFDRYLEPMAINLDVSSVYADPRSIKEKEETARFLSEVLDVNYDNLLTKLQKDKAFVWVKRKVDSRSAEKVKELDLKGVHFATESKRNYSNDNMASHVMGFVNIDNKGLEGLELLYDGDLRGKPGWRHLVRDAKMRTVLFNEEESIPAENGHNIVLTIDGVIQYITEDELKKMARKFNASSATAIIMDPFTGEVLAMANYPDFDLNASAASSRNLMKNDAVSSVYEPGSVFKIVAASAALEENTVTLEDTIYCENGEFRTGGRILHDYHGYGKLTFREVIAKSSNIGTVKVAQKIGEDVLYSYIRDFGFGAKTGIDMPGEISGISRHPKNWKRSDITTIPIGQGIAVTPIQLACAVSAIANGGVLMRPYIVDRITTWEGRVHTRYSPVMRGRVLSESTANKMKDILKHVVTIGTGRRANSKRYDFCGKTGTAQMVNPKGGYYTNKYDATFIGFAPMENPVIAVVVIAHDPHPIHFGGSVAGPAFKGIAERTLQYLGSTQNRQEKETY